SGRARRRTRQSRISARRRSAAQRSERAWIHRSGISASARGCVLSQGTTYHPASSARTTKLIADASPDARVEVMRGSSSARLEPAQRALARCKPGGRKYRRAVDRLPPARFHGAGERRGHVKRELPDTGGAVARDDRVVAPLHYAVAEAVAEFGGVDQQERWTDFFRLGGEQRQCRLEGAVGRRRGQHAQFDNAVVRVSDARPQALGASSLLMVPPAVARPGAPPAGPAPVSSGNQDAAGLSFPCVRRNLRLVNRPPGRRRENVQ